MRILVTGGAGYIGSVMTDVLIDNGHHVAVLDNLQRGHRDAVRSEAVFVEADLQQRDRVAAALRDERIEAVIHMAGDALVGESMNNPGKYYRTNVIAGLTLLEAMEQSAVRTVVFSSTCAVYGVPESVPIVETSPTRPVNPYGFRTCTRLVPCRPRVQGGVASLLQRSRSQRTLRRAPRARNAPHSARP
jgi:UDP-glucose 4-epimerase